MSRFTRIELFKENFKFSSGHFTIFSATERENIHGHNFSVYVAFEALVQDDGIIFNYATAKNFIESLCRSLNETMLLPDRSRHLRIEPQDDYIYAHFNGEKIPFLSRDVTLLPLENITIEELSAYLLDKFLHDFIKKSGYAIRSAEVKVFSGPGQSANAVWKGDA